MHNIELKYEWVESKQAYMWLYVDTGYYSFYQYIHKTYNKPTRKELHRTKQWCLERCKEMKYWEDM